MRAREKVEVKQRRADRGMYFYREGIEGRVEQWVKWSFNIPPKNEKGESLKYPDTNQPQGAWITIEKERLLRKYEVTEDGQSQAVDA